MSNFRALPIRFDDVIKSVVARTKQIDGAEQPSLGGAKRLRLRVRFPI
jgi:hypothetical protein